MKAQRILFLAVIFLLVPIASAASEKKSEIIGKANLSDKYDYVFLDTTTNGKYFYALYYISGRDKNSEATIACLRDKNNEGYYNGWYFEKLKTNPNRILASINYLICLDEIKGTIELYSIREDGSLTFIEQSDLVNKFKTVVKGNEALLMEK